MVSQAPELDLFHSREVPSAETRWVGTNRGRYASPELDSLIDRYTTTIPRAERTAALTEALRHMTDRLVVLNVYYSTSPTAIGKRLRNNGAREDLKVARDIVESGNTSSASIPMALDHMRAAGEISSGDVVLMVGFGAGLSYAGQVVRCP